MSEYDRSKLIWPPMTRSVRAFLKLIVLRRVGGAAHHVAAEGPARLTQARRAPLGPTTHQ